MARTKKGAQPKWKKKQAKKQQRQPETDGDAMDTAEAAPAEETVEEIDAVDETNEGDDEGPKKLSLGKLKKKQRWEQKLLKVKVGNLKKERLKLGKKNPVHKSDRKALTKQMKGMLAEQQKTHAKELEKGLVAQ